MADQTDKAQLSVPEGVLLAHALVARVADSLGVRAFFIKGPASVLQGLRQPKTSADVDVFVDPAGLEAVLQGLRERGWRQRPVDPDTTTFPKHAVTLHHPEWPCCVDVHFRFPGMEADPAECFEAMWAHTGEFDLAGQTIRVPSPALAIQILALHALRSPHLPACRQELAYLAELVQRQALVPGLMEIAAATGSLAAVRPFLEGLLEDPRTVAWPQASIEWRNRLLAREPGSARLVALVQAPWRAKPGLLWRAAFPQPQAFLGRNIYADMSWRGQVTQHRARWARFLRALPQVAKDLRAGG
ncbi:nucleotidyltransferase family protein [Arthrobacter sp. SD76]|uniref:nucleotidyltransferase family protein n=1 Tax=Arthrobacter sp. SD76 TaxID=3415007 RepID=UPI003C711357